MRSVKVLGVMCVSAVLACDDGGGGDEGGQDAGANVPSTAGDAAASSDGGGATNQDAAPAQSNNDAGGSNPTDAAQPVATGDTFYRATTLVLDHPKMVAKPPLLGEQDITGQAQGILNDAINTDGDGEGHVDLSLLIRFLDTSDPAAGNELVEERREQSGRQGAELAKISIWPRRTWRLGG